MIKKILTFFPLLLFLVSLFARPEAKWCCVLLKTSSSAPSGNAVATKFATSNPKTVYDYCISYSLNIIGNLAYSLCVANEDSAGTSCQYNRVLGNGTTDPYLLMEDIYTVDSAGIQAFKIQMMCRDSSVRLLYDYTHLLPEPWNSWGVILNNQRDGSVKLTLYQTWENANIRLPIVEETPQISHTISASIISATCSDSATAKNEKAENLGTINEAKIIKTPKLLFNVSPNQVNGNEVILDILNPALIEATPIAKIYDNAGKLIKEISIKQKLTTIDISTFLSGTYYLIISNEMTSKSVSFIK